MGARLTRAGSSRPVIAAAPLTEKVWTLGHGFSPPVANCAGLYVSLGLLFSGFCLYWNAILMQS